MEPDQTASKNEGDRLRLGLGLSLVAVALLLLAVASVLVIPQRLHPPLSAEQLMPLTPPQRLAAEEARRRLQNETRTPLLQGVAALAVFAGAGIAAWINRGQVRVARDTLKYNRQESMSVLNATREQLRLTEQGQITERFTRGIDQLGSDKRDVVLGGVYALQRIAQDSDKYVPVIAEVLCAYVREHAPWPPPKDSPYPPEAELSKLPELQRRAQDVQSVLTVLGREPFTRPEGVRLRFNLAGTDLRKAYLRGRHLERADLRMAHLEEANLQDVYLRGRGTLLAGAHLEGANFHGADLEGAQLEGAFADERTVWPRKGFDWKGRGVKRTALSPK